MSQGHTHGISDRLSLQEQGVGHQTDSVPQPEGRKKGLSTTKNIYSQLYSGARSIYRSFSFTHEFKHHFCLKAEGTGFPGKVRPVLPSHLVKTKSAGCCGDSGKVTCLSFILT